MSTVSVEVERLVVSLQGVSALVAEAAASGLEQEVQRRLGVLAGGDLAAFSMGELALGPVTVEMPLDSAALRGIIAEQIAQALLSNHTGKSPAGGGTD